MNLITGGSTSGLFLFQYLILYLTNCHKRICTSYVPQCFFHQMQLDPEERSRLPVQSMGKGRLSGQNINEPMYTYCCHLYLVFVDNS